MCEDYRLTRYCDDYHDINERKQKLEALIRQECPQTRIIYNKIRNRDLRYIGEFMQIYNFRCASGSSKGVDSGCISNLVLSCKCCNRDKSNFTWPTEYNQLLHPDEGMLKHVFVRDNGYYIRIAKTYESDDIILGFYRQLKLGSQKRRLDYLLIEMIGLKEHLVEKNPNSGRLDLLVSCIDLLLRRRNAMY